MVAVDPDETPIYLWIRHRGHVSRRAVACPASWPYSIAAWSRALSGRRPADGGPAVKVHDMTDGSDVFVTGSGRSVEDAMECKEMESRPLPACTCSVAHQTPDP